MPKAVLVAEPEPSTRGFLERHLADDGFDVLGAAACDEALELAELARPDLVLLGDSAALDECRSWSRVDLPAKEYELLLKLASEPTRVFTKEELLREVWGFQSIGRTRTLDSHASRLRRRLSSASVDHHFVLNVWGVGYRLLQD